MKKTLATIAILVFILVILPIGWYYWQNNSGNQGVDELTPPTQPKEQDLTQDLVIKNGKKEI